MLDEAKKREKIANALLGLSLAASAAQSPKDFVRTGHIESPGTALMQRWGRVRGEAERNLDHGRVGPSGRNRKVKTFEEFVAEAKKCWPGYKKKGTQKLFGKTYNRCVKEDWSKKYKDSIDCNNPKGFSQKAHCAGRKKRK